MITAKSFPSADAPRTLAYLSPAVILNEHLTEALRRLNQDNSSLTVDRRLVTNVLLQFLTTPRQDAKRFEMLSLLSSVLQWSDEEKELAGIQRSGGGFGRRLFGGGAASSVGRSAASTGTGATGQDEVSFQPYTRESQ